jgi:hypothetical protein
LFNHKKADRQAGRSETSKFRGEVMNRRKFLLHSAALAAAGVAPAVFAQTWPTKPIKLMADFPAGGGTDAMARLIADRLI